MGLLPSKGRSDRYVSGRLRVKNKQKLGKWGEKKTDTGMQAATAVAITLSSSSSGDKEEERVEDFRSLDWEDCLRRESTEFIRLRKESLLLISQQYASSHPKEEEKIKESSSSLSVAKKAAKKKKSCPERIPGVVGLENLGNTCFLNAALQCLANTAPLLDYLVGNKVWQRDLNKKNALGSGGELASELSALLTAMWDSKQASIVPRAFKHAVERFAPLFNGYQQHDCQELLCSLLDGLHEDLNRATDKPYIECPNADGLPDEVVAARLWANHLMRNKSVIVDLLQGQLRSSVTCAKCTFKSITFDPFMYLSLPFPAANTKREGALSVEMLLAEFIKEERLAGDNKWYCPKCKEFQCATKKLDLYKLPPILIIHLKRFRTEARGYRTSKIGTYVTFPMNNFYVTEHAVGDKCNLPGYDLYAVSRHMGGFGSGHYNAHAKSRITGEWYCFDDSRIRPIDKDLVADKNAYVLFYQNHLISEHGYRRQSVSKPNHWPHELPDRVLKAIVLDLESKRKPKR